MNNTNNNNYFELLEKISKNIKKARKKNGLTQEDMMEYGFNYRFYQKLESGKYSMSLKTLHKLSSIFDIRLIDLLK